MNKFKDFIYDKNDIIIAAAILIAAALLIWWRLNVILDYPQQLISESTDTNVTEITDSGDATDASSVDTTDTGDATTDANSDATGDDSSTTTELWADGALTRDIEVTVDGETASAAIQCLIDAGLFDDYAEYQSACDSQSLDDEKVSAGTFTFAKGSTKAQIARQVNWG